MHNREHNKFEAGDRSWIESRVFNALALDALGTHPLAEDIRARLALMVPARPDLAGLVPLGAGQRGVVCGETSVGFGGDGAINHLVLGGVQWASTNATLMALT